MKKLASFFLIILVSISASNRGYDGGDTAEYLKYFQIIASADRFYDAFDGASAYNFGYTFFSITYLISRVCDFQIYLFIISIISNILLLLLYKEYTNKYYLLIFIMSLSTITHYYYNYNAIRQPIANLLILLVIFKAFKYNSILKSIISFDLHASSIVCLPIHFLIRYYKKLQTDFKYLLVIYLIAVIIIGNYIDIILNIDNYNIFIGNAELVTFSFLFPLIIIFSIKILNVDDLSNYLIKFYIMIWLTRLIFYRYNELFLRISYCQHLLEPIFVFYIIKNLLFKFKKNNYFLSLLVIIISIIYFFLVVFPLYE